MEQFYTSSNSYAGDSLSQLGMDGGLPKLFCVKCRAGAQSARRRQACGSLSLDKEVRK